MRLFKWIITFVLVIFVLPALLATGWWAIQERPRSWREADWSPSGILPPAEANDEAAIYVLAARTGGLKGALSVHTWIVIKEEGAASYDRYDKVGWGSPVRHNAYAADARWYSNTPSIVASATGAEAGRLIPRVEAAIASYPFSKRGDYGLWPGPNSNSFTSHVLRSVPALHAQLPPTAIGRDYRSGFAFDHAPDWTDVRVSVGGLLGLAAGMQSGLELQFLGLVAGADFLRPALKVPGFGRVELWPWSSGSTAIAQPVSDDAAI